MSMFRQRCHQEKLTLAQRKVGEAATYPSPGSDYAMTHKKPQRKPDPAETIRQLADAKQQQAQQTPAWPGAKEQAEPQHARTTPADESVPCGIEKTPPSHAGYERSDINKRHH